MKSTFSNRFPSKYLNSGWAGMLNSFKSTRGYGIGVLRDLPKVETRVRVPLPAPSFAPPRRSFCLRLRLRRTGRMARRSKNHQLRVDDFLIIEAHATTFSKSFVKIFSSNSRANSPSLSSFNDSFKLAVMR